MIIAVEFQSKRDRKGSLEARSFRGASLELPRAVVVVVIVLLLRLSMGLATCAAGGLGIIAIPWSSRLRPLLHDDKSQQ